MLAREGEAVTWILYATLALAVTAAAAAVDFAHARYYAALKDGDRHRAARWSVVQWSAGVAGLMFAVRVSWWLLPFEGLGLYLGTLLGGTRPSASEVDPA